MRIIPAIDILGGRCVRLSQGDYGQSTMYEEDPLRMASRLAAAGIQFLHVVDLDGARERRVVNYRIVGEICSRTGLRVDFGGGIASEEDLRVMFGEGVQQVTVGTVALRSPSLFLEWLEKFGPDRIILGADCRNRMVSASGWTEDSSVDVLDILLHYAERGAKYTICTDISRDGMLTGPAVDLYREILDRTGLRLIASGGIASAGDLDRLEALGCEGAIVGKAMYEGHITLEELAARC